MYISGFWALTAAALCEGLPTRGVTNATKGTYITFLSLYYFKKI